MRTFRYIKNELNKLSGYDFMPDKKGLVSIFKDKLLAVSLFLLFLAFVCLVAPLPYSSEKTTAYLSLGLRESLPAAQTYWFNILGLTGFSAFSVMVALPFKRLAQVAQAALYSAGGLGLAGIASIWIEIGKYTWENGVTDTRAFVTVIVLSLVAVIFPILPVYYLGFLTTYNSFYSKLRNIALPLRCAISVFLLVAVSLSFCRV